MLNYYTFKIGFGKLDDSDCHGVHNLFYVIERKDIGFDALRSFLVHYNGDFNLTSRMYGSLLFHSIFHRNINAIRLLISFGVDVNVTDSRGNPVIFYCVVNGLLEISNMLINAPGFDVDKPNNSEESILEVSILKNMSIHSNILLQKHPIDLRCINQIKKLIHMCIDSKSTVLAWKLYQNYAACVIQSHYKRMLYFKRLSLQNGVNAIPDSTNAV